MTTREEQVAEAYRQGRVAGYNKHKGYHAKANPYTDGLLSETWQAGFNDGNNDDDDN